jgi:phytoene dehydrogenase-like protein
MVPGTIIGDASGAIGSRDWASAKEEYADRVMDIIETYAPGTTGKVLARHVLAPTDLEEANPNLIGGDSLGGSHHLMQHFFLRPFPGWTRYKTPVKNLYMCGAGTWPGAGVGAGSGYLLGKQLTEPGMISRVTSTLKR